MKTDALTINKKDLEKAKTLLDLTAGIGNWRVSKTEEIKIPIVKLDMRENDEIVMEALKVNNIELTMAEEYDVDHLCNLFKEHKRVMVRSEYAEAVRATAVSICCIRVIRCCLYALPMCWLRSMRRTA